MPIIADAGQQDIRVSELLSQTETARQTGRNIWQIQRLIKNKQLETVRLPNGSRAVLRSSLERYLERQK